MAMLRLQECNITYLGGGFIFWDVHRYLGKSIQFDGFFRWVVQPPPR